MNRRQLLATAALLPLAAVPTIAPKAATECSWQSWPVGTPRPDEWVRGSTTIRRYLTRLREDGPDSWFARCHIKAVW